MKINGLRKLLEKKLHLHAAMFHGITSTIWLENRVNNMAVSALNRQHLQVKPKSAVEHLRILFDC